MHDPKEIQQFPFLTREMLKFGNKAKIEIFIDLWSSSLRDYVFSTLTSEGVTSQKFNVASDGQNTLELFRLSEIPIFATLRTDDTAAEIGDAYAVMTLRIDGVVIGILTQGPIAIGFGLHWPGGPHIPPLSYRGHSEIIVVANPAVNTEWTVTIQDAEVWEIKAITWLFTTDANVGNRSTSFEIKLVDAGTAITLGGGTTQAANIAQKYILAPFGHPSENTALNATRMNLPPGLRLGEGSIIRTQTSDKKAGDQYSDIGIFIEKLIAPLT